MARNHFGIRGHLRKLRGSRGQSLPSYQGHSSTIQIKAKKVNAVKRKGGRSHAKFSPSDGWSVRVTLSSTVATVDTWHLLCQVPICRHLAQVRFAQCRVLPNFSGPHSVKTLLCQVFEVRTRFRCLFADCSMQCTQQTSGHSAQNHFPLVIWEERVRQEEGEVADLPSRFRPLFPSISLLPAADPDSGYWRI